MASDRPEIDEAAGYGRDGSRLSRRRFAGSIVGSLGVFGVLGCGGGGSVSAVAQSASVSTPSSPGESTGVLRVSLTAGSESNYPLQFGRPFRAGQITGLPSLYLDGQPLPSQADIKTRHSDGSVKFAVISTVLPLLDTTERSITFTNNASVTTQQALGIAQMLAGFDFDATIELRAAAGTLLGPPLSAYAMLAALSDGDLAAQTASHGVQSRYWTRGPLCTTVILCDHERKSHDVGSGSGAVIRPMFHVQFWPTIGRYHVRHIVEIADVTKLKDETDLTIAFTTGRASPTVRLIQSGVNLYAGTWQSRAYWGGLELPRANVKHDVAYLASTLVMPNYDASIVMQAGAMASYAADWVGRDQSLMASGYWQKAMASTGGRPDLGLMPKWDTVAMYSGAAHMQAISERHAEFAGAWAFYFREGASDRNLLGSVVGNGRIVSKLARPTVHLYDGNNYIANGNPSDKFLTDGTLSTTRDGWSHDHAHTPGLFWWQYLSTGQAFWHEKLLQLAAWSQFLVNPGISFNTVGNGPDSRHLIMNGVQVRGWGWQFRNRARAWWAATDGSPEKALLERMLVDAAAQRAGLYDVPGMMLNHDIRVAWNSNHALWYVGAPLRPRPNPLNFWDRKGPYSADQIRAAMGSEPPDDWGGGATAPWMQNFVTLALGHAVELGFDQARPLLQWCGLQAILIANSAEPRHIADFVLPDTKNDGGFYQSLNDLYDGYAHDADGASPPGMPADNTRGFAGAGAPGTLGVTFEGYGSIAAAAIAIANGTSGQAAAWQRVGAWHAATVFYNHDPRYAILPRAGTVS